MTYSVILSHRNSPAFVENEHDRLWLLNRETGYWLARYAKGGYGTTPYRDQQNYLLIGTRFDFLDRATAIMFKLTWS